MNVTNLLKFIYENMPKKIKLLLSPVFIRIMVKNKEFRRTWNELEEFESLSAEEKKMTQLKYLRSTLVYAYNNVQYYKELFDRYSFNPKSIVDISDISVLPVLEKTEAVALGDKL